MRSGSGALSTWGTNLNCNTYEVGVAVYKTQAFRNLEYKIEKASADLIILQNKGLHFVDLLYCVGLRALRKNPLSYACIA